MPELILKLADQILQTVSFDKDEIKIGRARDNDIVIENLNISRYHVQIRQQNGLYYLKDNNSSNGTLVNGVKITKTEIIDGDVIGLGKYKIHFRNANTMEVKLGGQYNEIEHTILSEPQVTASLEVISGKLKGRTFPLTKFETTIGKAPDNDIVFLDDWLLAKQQATIIKQGNSDFQLIDKGGLRKIKINGSTAPRNHVLQDNDSVEFGSIRCVFRCEKDSPISVGRVPEEIGDQSVIISTSAAGEEPSDEISSEADKLHELIFSTASAAINGERPFDLEESHPIPPFDALPPVNQQTAPAVFSGTDSVSIEGKSSSRIRRRNRRDRERLKNKSGISSSSKKPSPPSHPSSDQFPSAPAPSTPSVPPPPVADNEKEIKMWEAALQNPSLPIRKQAARMLKSLTGKEYDVE